MTRYGDANPVTATHRKLTQIMMNKITKFQLKQNKFPYPVA